jgi:drug/metabolite transporter (DMT)-like permease
VPLSALALALGAAVMHASWNVLLAGARDSEAATAVATLAGVALLAPVAIVTGGVESEALPFAATSAALHVAYLALLARAYHGGEVSVVYPVSRGSAPVLVLIGAAVVLGESPSWVQACGVVAVGVGVLLVRGLSRDADRAGEVLGLLVGVTIAAYTVVDKRGVGHAAALPYLLLLEGPSALVYLAMVSRSRGRVVLDELRWLTVVAGIGMVAAYGLVLAALQRGSAAGVAATRETSILIATLLGALFIQLVGYTLVANGVPDEATFIVTAAIIVVAVWLQDSRRRT